MTVLRCERLEAGYGTPVVRGIELAVDAGQVVALLGGNGSGKTTVLLTISGFLPLLGGTVEIDGALHPGEAAAVARCGVVLVPDDRALFTTLTVRDHLRLAGGAAPDAEEVLELFPRLQSRLDLRAGALSGGEQQMLALARAVVQSPRVLLIDELSMGLAPMLAESLVTIVRRIADETGAAIVLVEQHVRLALAVSDRAVVLNHGNVVVDAPAADLAADPEEVRAAYLGSSPGAGYWTHPRSDT